LNLANQLALKLEESGKITFKLFNALTEEEWFIEVYSDGPAWKIRNLLAHFTEVESAIPTLIREILAGSSGVEQDFDIDRYNAIHVEKVSQLNNGELLNAFEHLRNSTIQMVANLGKDELEIWGRHPFLGHSQIKDMVKLMFLHIRIHERDIRKVLEENH